SIRPFLASKDEASNAPSNFETIDAKGKGLEDYKYKVQVSVLDCTGCGSCANVCPAKEKALVMKPLGEQLDETSNWEYASSLTRKPNPMDVTTVKGSQFELPLLEFSGACAGCGETPYAKLITQLYGDRMYIANATGCSQAWATSYPSFPYTVNEKGQGPTYTNSLFENNAEFGLGIMLAVDQQRDRIKSKVERLIEITMDNDLKKAAINWVETFADGSTSKAASEVFLKTLKNSKTINEEKELVSFILNSSEHLVKKSIWLFGGDGWAYDIGYGGLDHVISTRADVNILVLDTEVYSNTGGQSSKATPLGAVAQ
ncbi:4Fe-4S binding protein, partial [Clostridium sp. DSM 17811]|uniref:4Fe-4S binding protein n=1 Tax=Clostridium sp. DSM 17811 TaxID=2843317 RepID=UPI001C0D1098